ncbi:hypothetical protein EV426DRAFT_717773 [Tirmania nivea]|nr:hypothetical protein EV426DRAFT_717773 [Tirmania nivea]
MEKYDSGVDSVRMERSGLGVAGEGYKQVMNYSGQSLYQATADTTLQTEKRRGRGRGRGSRRGKGFGRGREGQGRRDEECGEGGSSDEDSLGEDEEIIQWTEVLREGEYKERAVEGEGACVSSKFGEWARSIKVRGLMRLRVIRNEKRSLLDIVGERPEIVGEGQGTMRGKHGTVEDIGMESAASKVAEEQAEAGQPWGITGGGTRPWCVWEMGSKFARYCGIQPNGRRRPEQFGFRAANFPVSVFAEVTIAYIGEEGKIGEDTVVEGVGYTGSMDGLGEEIGEAL